MEWQHPGPPSLRHDAIPLRSVGNRRGTTFGSLMERTIVKWNAHPGPPSLPAPDASPLRSVWGSDVNNVRAVGSAEHRSGTVHPPSVFRHASNLYGVWGIDANNHQAAGEGGTILADGAGPRRLRGTELLHGVGNRCKTTSGAVGRGTDPAVAGVGRRGPNRIGESETAGGSPGERRSAAINWWDWLSSRDAGSRCEFH